uniref:Enolase superfamily member 1 n=1 Tax=Mandrillus leucophaeus TaxID=9568 RepID=A0A2K5Y6P6_MANLE
HTDPDYSAAYVIIETDAEDGIKGCGITFTLGKGTEVDWSREGCGAPGDSSCPKCGVGLVGQAGGKACLEVTCGHEKQMLAQGYPAYTTSCAWLGYSDDTLKQLCAQALKDGWTRFKLKVGADLQDDVRRCQIIRDMIGPEKTLALVPLGIGIATGEQCHNRVIFKQLLQAKALQFLQIDSCRLGSVNENLSVLLMAKKFEIPVCPHAGGVGLCELVQHLIIFDYISVSASLKNRMCEYVDHLHEHFKYPVMIQRASYMPPKDPGYSTEMKEESVKKHQYPDGEVWKKLLAAQEN